LKGGPTARSGVVVLDSSSKWGETPYANEAYHNDIALGARLQLLGDAGAIRQVFPSEANVSSFTNVTGYLNRDGGWAHASQGVSLMMKKVTALGGQILAGQAAETLLRHNEQTSGVRCTDGTVFHAQVVILAAGSWTASLFPELRLNEQCIATGQCIATIQLTPAETEIYQDCPVVLDFGSGFYVFPDGIMKMAIHAAGYTHTPTSGPPISTPRTVTSHAQEGLLIPKSDVDALRRHLRHVYPDLAEKPFCGTRLCWYADSPDGDWIICSHPLDSSLVLATAGSGHAYKFLPVIGRLVADVVQGTLDPLLGKKFAINRGWNHVDLSRFRNGVDELDVEQLCSAEDLLRIE